MKRSARHEKSTAEVHCVWVQVRGSTVNDPGEIAPRYYIVDDGVLLLTDAQGEILTDDDDATFQYALSASDDPGTCAKRLALRTLKQERAFFGRALAYPTIVVV